MSTISAATARPVVTKRAGLRVIGPDRLDRDHIQLSSQRYRHGTQILRVARDHRVASPEAAHDHVRVDDVRGAGAAERLTDRAGAFPGQIVGSTALEEPGQIGLPATIPRRLSERARRNHWDHAALERPPVESP